MPGQGLLVLQPREIAGAINYAGTYGCRALLGGLGRCTEFHSIRCSNECASVCSERKCSPCCMCFRYGSGISILSEEFVLKHGFARSGRDSPLVWAVGGATLSLPWRVSSRFKYQV